MSLTSFLLMSEEEIFGKKIVRKCVDCGKELEEEDEYYNCCYDCLATQIQKDCIALNFKKAFDNKK